jgi:hypothetical protein
MLRGAGAAVVAAVAMATSIGFAGSAQASRVAAVRSSTVGQRPSSFAFQPITMQRIDLPSNIKSARWPVFTHDDQHMMFWSSGELWITTLEGTDVHCLTCGLANDPDISGLGLADFATPFPDGKRVLIEEDAQIVSSGMVVLDCEPSLIDCQSRRLVPVNYSQAEPLVIPPGGASSLPQIGVPHVAAHAQLSPDGQYVGFSEARSDAIEAMIVGKLQLEGDEYVVADPRVINPPGPTSPTDPNVAAWSDSSALYEFKTFTDGGADATYVQGGGSTLMGVRTWSVNLATGQRTLLASHPDWNEDNGVSPNGKLMSLFSDRTVHYVDWVSGLLPVRSFIDAPGSATVAAATGGSSECMGPMWLLPSTGDDNGELMGEPLVDYSYPGVHVVDTLAESSQWSPDGTMIALNTIDDPTGEAAPFLLVADLTAVKPSQPLPAVSAEPGSWAPAPADYHGAMGYDGKVTLDGPGGGTVTVDYGGLPGALEGSWSETYDNYSDNGKDFVNGTVAVTALDAALGPATYSAHLTMTGADTGSDDIDIQMSSSGITGHAQSTYDGNTVTGPAAVETGPEASGGARSACPSMLPKEPALRATKTRVGHGSYRIKVTVSIAGAGANELGVDTQPVNHATIKIGRKQIYTNSAGVVTVKAKRSQEFSVSAGDTLLPTSGRLRH